jgi:hypothetical protein
LIPFELTEEVAERFVKAKGHELSYDNYLDQFEDDPSWYAEDIVKVAEEWFEVHWEVEREQDVYCIAEAQRNADGSIDFHTYHYNGGAHWTEVVEDALNDK